MSPNDITVIEEVEIIINADLDNTEDVTVTHF